MKGKKHVKPKLHDITINSMAVSDCDSGSGDSVCIKNGNSAEDTCNNAGTEASGCYSSGSSAYYLCSSGTGF